jgi:hypothetical protein
MRKDADLAPEQKAALAALFRAAFELGYRQGSKGATPADNDAVIRDTLRAAVEIIQNTPDDLVERLIAADNFRDPKHSEKLDQPSELME